VIPSLQDINATIELTNIEKMSFLIDINTNDILFILFKLKSKKYYQLFFDVDVIFLHQIILCENETILDYLDGLEQKELITFFINNITLNYNDKKLNFKNNILNIEVDIVEDNFSSINILFHSIN